VRKTGNPEKNQMEFKNPLEITDQAENLRGSFTGEYGNAQYQAYRYVNE